MRRSICSNYKSSISFVFLVLLSVNSYANLPTQIGEQVVLQSLPATTKFELSTDNGALIEGAWETLQAQDKAFSYEYEGVEWESDLACHQHTACVREELVKVATSIDEKVTVYGIEIVSQSLGVWINNDNEESVGNYNIQLTHHAVLVVNESNQWSIIDPIVFGDAGLHSVNAWLSQFKQDDYYYLISQ